MKTVLDFYAIKMAASMMVLSRFCCRRFRCFYSVNYLGTLNWVCFRLSAMCLALYASEWIIMAPRKVHGQNGDKKAESTRRQVKMAKVKTATNPIMSVCLCERQCRKRYRCSAPSPSSSIHSRVEQVEQRNRRERLRCRYFGYRLSHLSILVR